MNIADLRREYIYGGLSREDLNQDPLVLFKRWFEQARHNLPYIENAMTLATSGSANMPSIRTVLLKHFDAQGFVFFTNYTSQKGQNLAENPQAALLFQWLEFDRQVIVQGEVRKTSIEESEAYFASRPRGSQIAAWISRQDQIINSRKTLLTATDEAEKQFADTQVPLPEDWGGYRLKPTRLEFWQGRPNRLHDRFEYIANGEAWEIHRLSP